MYSDSITVHYSPVDYCICCYWEMSTVTMLLLYVFYCVLEWVDGSDICTYVSIVKTLAVQNC